MEKKILALSELTPGPIRHETLDAGLLARIAAIHEALHDVLPGTLAEWVDDFRRDMHPEIEVEIWEQIVANYLGPTTGMAS